MERAGPEERRRRRALAGHLLRAGASVVLLTSLYYLAPLDRGVGVGTAVVLVLGLVLFGCLTAWQITAITHAEYPRLRAIETLATAVPLFLVLFSATYFVLADNRPSSFSEPLSRTGALYFTVTVFATVGFGDIAPTTDTSRALTTVQMILDLIVVGVIAKALFGAVQVGLRRRGDPDDRL